MARRFISSALLMLITLVLCETVLRVADPSYVKPFVGAGHRLVASAVYGAVYPTVLAHMDSKSDEKAP